MAETLDKICARDVLVISHHDRGIDFTNFYRQLEKAGVRITMLDKPTLKQLPLWLADTDLGEYRRVIVDLPFKYLHKAARQLSRIHGLVIYEEDACQNFLPTSKWHGKFTTFYEKLPNALVINTGAAVSGRLRELGIRSVFIPKGYDESVLTDRGNDRRDIEFGFIGRTRSSVYDDRERFLNDFSKALPLQILRTESADEYCETLNRIKVFVSADIGIGEYMAKNFEAMACGCCLLAARQGDNEEVALGLEDGANVLLYDDLQDAIAKAQSILAQPQKLANIADAGKRLVQQNHRYEVLSQKLLDSTLNTPLPAPATRNPWYRFWS